MKLDLKEWLAKVTGQTEFKTLLWTNPSPSSAFAAQTITLDLTSYNAVDIICRVATNDVETKAERCDTGSSVMVSRWGGGNGYGAGGVFLIQRFFTVTATGISVLRGLGGFASDANFPYSNDTRMIPYKIYGIRYVGGVIHRLLNTLQSLRYRKAVVVC